MHTYNEIIVECLKKLLTYSAWTLHPWFTVDLHWKTFAGGDGDATALSQSSTGMTKSSFHLAHVQTVL